MTEQTKRTGLEVAVIGMAAAFPGAGDIDTFWENLKDGVSSISFLDEQELEKEGVPKELSQQPNFVPSRGGVLDNRDMFDAEFFGYTPLEARVMDPQLRLLHQCCWQALEHAGYCPGDVDGTIGLYAGSASNFDWQALVLTSGQNRGIEQFVLDQLLDKNFICTRVAYKLNLRGPAVAVQSACSTSLLAIHLAARALVTGECDMALAGGVAVQAVQAAGYVHHEGMVMSPDGVCRSFDAAANGTIGGNGAGIVALKRLKFAEKHGDHILAVIKGSGSNNDGNRKVGFTAPSIEAQEALVRSVLHVSRVPADSISYVEAHGSGTPLGDPIEIEALTGGFNTQNRQYCAVGSVKTNIGHLDNAAGVAGLIKTALALHHKQIPPSLHFSTPNPKINFDDSPFFVNTQLREWTTNGAPRRAGVTSLGMGGTNAHVVLEEAPQVASAPSSRATQLLLLSTKTAGPMEEKTSQLAAWFQENRDTDVADVAFTLALGRRDFARRRFAIVQGSDDAAESLANLTAGKVFDGEAPDTSLPVMFMFSGQGSQYAGMARELYELEPGFKQDVDRCAGYLSPIMGLDIRDILFPAPDAVEENNAKLKETWVTQPVMFVVEYCLARLVMGWGIRPAGMIGHSIGEYVAACIAGCFELEEALKVVAARGRFMHAQASGAMLSVPLAEAEVLELLPEGLALAAINSPNRCVVSGPEEQIAAFESLLADKQLFPRRLHTSHAFHSPMMQPAVKDLEAALAGVTIKEPRIPFVSCLTGQWIKSEEAKDPQYWGRQLRETVRFSGGISTILKEAPVRLLEVGPGDALCVLARERVPKEDPNPSMAFQSLKHAKQTEGDMAFLQKTLGQLWLNGVTIDWPAYFANENRRRVPLPAYPFERKRYWLEVDSPVVETSAPIAPTEQPAQEEPQAAKSEEKAEAKKTFQPRPALANNYIAPEDDIQEGIAAIWQDILGIKPIGVQDNFFDLGGHSLLATLFLSKIQDTFHIRLELGSIFESPTIETIARLVKEKLAEEESGDSLESILGEVEGMTGLEE